MKRKRFSVEQIVATLKQLERFCDGHLCAMIEKGYVQRVLQRLKEIS